MLKKIITSEANNQNLHMNTDVLHFVVKIVHKVNLVDIISSFLNVTQK